MRMIKNLCKVASERKPNICRKLLQTAKERIDFAKNHSLYINLHITAYKWTN